MSRSIGPRWIRGVGGVGGDGMTVTNSPTSDSSLIYHFVSNESSWNAYYHTIHFFFLSIDRDPNTWPANNCLQIIVCSCLVPSERVLLRIIFCSCLVQSLNSPFFPPHIGAEPGRAKEESRITCMRMLKAPPFFPPKSGENPIWKYFPDLACGAIFWMITYKQQFLHSDWLKTCQLIPDQWNFISATLNHIRFVF